MTTPTYVKYEGKRRRVLAEGSIDDELAYLVDAPEGRIWARHADCEVWTRSLRERRRRLKDGSYVLEFAAGEISIRRARSPRRFSLTLGDVYQFAVRCATLKGSRVPKALRARGRRR